MSACLATLTGLAVAEEAPPKAVPVAPPKATPVMPPKAAPVQPVAPPPPPPPAPAATPVLPPAPPARPDGPMPADPDSATEGEDETFRAYVVPEIDLTPVQTAEDGAVWQRNPGRAFRRARAQRKPLLLLVTARWNSGCQALSSEVFSSKTFNNWARDQVVLCFLDYPQNINQAPPSMKRFKEKYSLRGYPSLLIFNPEGQVVREIRGYRQGRPVDYFNELEGAVDPLLRHLANEKSNALKKGFRDWKNPTGDRLFARFLRHDGMLVVLEDPEGQRWTLPLTGLSETDQELVRSFPTLDQVLSPAKGRQIEIP